MSAGSGFAPLTAPSSPYGESDLTYAVPDELRVEPRHSLREPVDPNVFVNAYTRPLPSPAETFSGPGYESRPMPTSGLAVAALVFGIAGVFLVVPALAAIVLGHLGLRQTNRRTHAGRGLAMGGLVLGYAAATVVALVLLGFWISSQ